ncbi:MAG: hypothetical protein ACLGGX_09345 [Bdellovibrionia bacterium]
MKKTLILLLVTFVSLFAHAKGGRYFCKQSGSDAGKLETSGIDENGNELFKYFKNSNSNNGWLLRLVKENRDIRKGDLFNADERFRDGEEFYVGSFDHSNGINIRMEINNLYLICIREM